MTARIIDGNALSAKLRGELAAKAAELTAQGTQPCLAVILVGGDPASAVYVRNKVAGCEKAGIKSLKFEYPQDAAPADVLAKIAALNADPAVHGILVQLPLPGALARREQEITGRILPEKDVDGFHPVNVGRLVMGEPGLVPDRTAWQHSRVVALLSPDLEPAVLLAAAANEIGIADTPKFDVREVEEQDWVRLTQSQFEPVEITPDFWIVPTWHELPAAALRSIRLDPGLAFGTGTHPTTRMCLRWIARQGGADGARALGRVLDYGCGSGILAMGAAKFGASDIDAVDIDAAAVEATRQNAQANGVQLNAGLPDQARGEYQTVLANILATPLKVLAPLLCAHVARGGHLVLAGILERQTQELQQAYAPYLQLTVADTQDGWVLLTGQRPA